MKQLIAFIEYDDQTQEVFYGEAKDVLYAIEHLERNHEVVLDLYSKEPEQFHKDIAYFKKMYQDDKDVIFTEIAS